MINYAASVFLFLFLWCWFRDRARFSGENASSEGFFVWGCALGFLLRLYVFLVWCPFLLSVCSSIFLCFPIKLKIEDSPRKIGVFWGSILDFLFFFFWFVLVLFWFVCLFISIEFSSGLKQNWRLQCHSLVRLNGSLLFSLIVSYLELYK